MYCDACDVQIASPDRNVHDTRSPGVRRNNSCNENLEQGKNQEIFVEFCFPTLQRFFESKQLNPDIWQDIVVSRNKKWKKYNFKINIFLFRMVGKT